MIVLSRTVFGYGRYVFKLINLLRFQQLALSLLQMQHLTVIRSCPFRQGLFCACRHAQLCCLLHVIKSDLIHIYCPTHYIVFFSLFCFSSASAVEIVSVATVSGSVAVFLFLMCLSLQMLCSVILPLILMVLVYPYHAVKPGQVHCVMLTYYRPFR